MVSKLHLVDLAGSERQKKTKAEGDRLKEGECNQRSMFIYIIASLLHFEEIKFIVHASTQPPHIFNIFKHN